MPHQQHSHGSVKAYVAGFLLSLVLTVIPLALVVNRVLSPGLLVPVILVIAVLQFVVQLVFFMHIREGEKPRYNVMALILGMIFVFTIVAGSAWIMTFGTYVH